jgi:hypothetical protein
MPPSTFSYTSADGTQIGEIIAELTGWLDRVVAPARREG